VDIGFGSSAEVAISRFSIFLHSMTSPSPSVNRTLARALHVFQRELQTGPAKEFHANAFCLCRPYEIQLRRKFSETED
jgi:hypothetical protein